MDSVPYDFIERTIHLTYPVKEIFNPSPFAPLGGHWGRYAILLQNTTQRYNLTVNICDLPNLYCSMTQGEISVRIEDVLQKKHYSVCGLKIYYSQDISLEAEKIDKQKKEMLRRLVRRSNGLTTMELDIWPIDAPLLDDLLEAVPRIEDIVMQPAVINDSAVISLVEKHLQQKCLKKLSWNGPNTTFPVVTAFLRESEFLYFFQAYFIPPGEDLAMESIKLIATNLKKRMSRMGMVEVKALPTVIDELKKKIGYAFRIKSFLRHCFGCLGNVVGEQAALKTKVIPIDRGRSRIIVNVGV